MIYLYYRKGETNFMNEVIKGIMLCKEKYPNDHIYGVYESSDKYVYVGHYDDKTYKEVVGSGLWDPFAPIFVYDANTNKTIDSYDIGLDQKYSDSLYNYEDVGLAHLGTEEVSKYLEENR